MLVYLGESQIAIGLYVVHILCGHVTIYGMDELWSLECSAAMIYMDIWLWS